jgi:hypothetical protein
LKRVIFSDEVENKFGISKFVSGQFFSEGIVLDDHKVFFQLSFPLQPEFFDRQTDL